MDDNVTLNERFLDFVPAEDLTAESLTKYIVDTLSKHNIDVNNIVSQGYDGAAVMSGHCSGVQTRIQQLVPKAFYVHCNAHCLNLALVDTVKSVREAAEFFTLLEKLYVFMSTSKAHVIYVKWQHNLNPNKQPQQLQHLSDTRWACRSSAISAVCHTYDSILATLSDIEEGKDAEKAVEARGLLHLVNSFQFLLSLVTFDCLFSCTKRISDILQAPKINLSIAAELITATIETMHQFRTDEEWSKVYKYTVEIASLHKIPVACHLAQSRRSRQQSKRMTDYVVTETTGIQSHHDTDSQADPMTTYKCSLYFPVLDHLIAELNRRFTDKNKSIMSAIHACSPVSDVFLSVHELQPQASNYFYS